ncbi:Helix-turn-helix domain-containing protein [Butyrivibrio sp. ob235]|uniref:helix-turn-helix domain-containing protein n=1 Tax=Butyrivibrio sp. ob235 TaxID=1761780 RepID=UPI0008CAB0B8|nr:helix-turn-helix transcriptional regulator [Butyrivibrio sp. ob235]SEM38576.1 Helix-turn-helix domain-containing protein [Butyrivibrio sp. ob235]
MKEDNSLGDRLRKLREDKKLRQVDLAKLFHISNPNVISMYEKENRIPTTEIILKYSELFMVSTDWILKGNNCKSVGVLKGYRCDEMLQKFSSIEKMCFRDAAVEQLSVLIRLQELTN